MGNDLQLYTKLLGLPLFQGLGKADLEDIVSENDICNRLHFLLNGQIEVITTSASHGYQIKEELVAPELLQPERLFGLTQRFTKTFKTLTVCNVLCVEKDEVMRLSDAYMIFRINLLNMLSTYAQKNERMLLRRYPESLEGRVIRFIADRCLRPAGKKTVKIKMRQLALELNDSRLDISKALNHLEENGVVALRRNYIDIERLEAALQYIQQ